ncbi:MAG: cobalamin-dependent protein [Acidobacteriota bacterium]
MRLLLVSIPIDFPLAVYGLAAQLGEDPRTAGVEVDVLDLDISRLNAYNRKNAEIWRYIAHLERSRPDVVGFSVYLWNHLAFRELAGITRRLFPRIRIVVGGPEVAEARASTPWLREDLATVAVHGEGEETLVELLARFGGAGPADAGSLDLAGVAGASWLADGEVRREPPRPPRRHLGELASPYLSGWLGDDAFTRTDAGPGRYRRALLETYRGCYMQCSYCQWGNGTLSRFAFPTERVLAELTWLLERRVAEVWIIDAMFGFKKRLAKDILRHIAAEKARTGAETGVVCYHNQDFYDPELFELYREAGVTVEVDIQSTAKPVLDRVGRGKWYIESFDRHLEAFREHRVPTSGAADLMIGLPLDRLETFEASVDFLLRRRMRVNLYQTSIIPQTPMGRTLDEDGTVFAPLAPRSVLENATFPVGEVVTARLIGHGVDFFRLFPNTARLLWRLGRGRPGLGRPVDLCRRFGERVWERTGLMFGESHTHESVLAGEVGQSRPVLEDLCVEPAALEPLIELFALERAAGLVAPRDVAGERFGGRAVLAGGGELPSDWLAAAPVYRRAEVEEVPVEYRLDRLLALCRGAARLDRESEAEAEPLPSGDAWRALRSPSPLVALVYRKGPRHSSYRLVDRGLTHALLERMNGFFTIAECLHNLLGPGWAAGDLEPLRRTLASLVDAGFLDLKH